MKWIIDVSNPRKSYSGHTLYRISTKVIKNEFQEFSDVFEEIVVWRRFSEYKKLHKELTKLYLKQDQEEPIPSPPKATFFDRFDDAVIEERRKSILVLLNFAAGVPRLADSKYLEKFLGGGIYSPSSSSRASSVSGSEGDIADVALPSISKENVPRNQDEKSTQGDYIDLGGVWLYKQPSLGESLDTADTVKDISTLDSPQSAQMPKFILRSLSFEDREDNAIENSSSSGDSNDEVNTIAESRTSIWLQRAISLCSEGEDIETLASEAENDEFLNELNFLKPFSDTENDEATNLKVSITEKAKDQKNSHSNVVCGEAGFSKACSYNTVSSKSNEISASTTAKNTDEPKSHYQNTYTTSKKTYESCIFLPQHSSCDCLGRNYLHAATNVARDALSFELHCQYKEAFHLYKTCVNLLLNGVQEEKDCKRREAVRRKTAQYLLKAEALYTAYTHNLNKVIPDTKTGPLSRTIYISNEGGTASHLQLTEFSVIGVIGKVILVEKKTDKNTFVIKILSKTEEHRHHKSKRVKRRRQLLKSAYSICPFMVQLHQHSESETAVYLLLEYARGGLLWDYIPFVSQYQDHNNVNSYVHNLKETEIKTRLETINPPKPSVLRTSTGNKMDQLDDNGKSNKLFFATLRGKFNEISNWSSQESVLRLWMAEMVVAVEHVHRNGITCRDLNPNNLLLSDSGHILLSHFSSWIGVNEKPDLFSLHIDYCAPELFKMEEVTMTADWWSVGALFYEMLIGKSLARSYPRGIRLHNQVDMPNHVSPEAASLLKELLIVTPSERLGHGVNGVDNIKSHPFFADIDWTMLTP